MGEGSCDGRDPSEGCLVDFIADVGVVVLDVPSAPQPPIDGAQRQRPVRNGIFFDGKTDLEKGFALVIAN
ncbi:hypothetical protein D3C78_1077600 [compost metagenome]